MITRPSATSPRKREPLFLGGGLDRTPPSSRRMAVTSTRSSRQLPAASTRASFSTAVNMSSTRSASSTALRNASRSASEFGGASSALSSFCRKRVSGERRSCAIASPAVRVVCIKCSSRSSMAFMSSARASNSSPAPRTGARRVRSPAMTSRAVSDSASARRAACHAAISPLTTESRQANDRDGPQRARDAPGDHGAVAEVARHQQDGAVEQSPHLAARTATRGPAGARRPARS